MKHLMTITNDCEDWEWEDAHINLQSILDKTKIKRGFLEIKNGGWRSQHGHTEPFEITSINVINKAGLNGYEFTLEVKKEGHQLYLIRSSHDEPMGATILLRSMKHYNKVINQIYN